MDIRLIDYFGVALGVDTKDEIKSDPREVNNRATRVGYIVHPDCCTKSVMEWLDCQSVNYNSTFYQNWSSVLEKDRFELFIDQIIHYACAYELGVSVTPNDQDYSMVPEIKNYKVIMPITVDDLSERVKDMLRSGIALKGETLDTLIRFISTQDIKVDPDEIKNREAQIHICAILNITPQDPIQLLHYIYYKATGETMIVKDAGCKNRVYWGNPFDMTQLTDEQLEGLASIFFRFKPVFMGLKTKKNAHTINRIRRMADARHKPMSVGFWESIVNTPTDYDAVLRRLEKDKPTSFKLIRLIQAIKENRLKIGGTGHSMYTIRNGKVWLKALPEYPALDPRYDWWDALETILYRELVNRLKDKACVVRFPKDLHLACPTSEKTFVGNIPWGSYYDMTQNNIVGIYWRDEWGAQDLDLSFITFSGLKLGWNSQYHAGDELIYSGDVVRACPEAAECFFIRQNSPNGLIKVNMYNGRDGSTFKFMVAQDDTVTKIHKNYMVDPNTIVFQTETQITGEKMIGYVLDNRLCICELQTGSSRVSSASVGEWQETLKRKMNSFVDLKQLLLDAGFKERKRPSKDNPIELDLTDLDKDTLTKLFS